MPTVRRDVGACCGQVFVSSTSSFGRIGVRSDGSSRNGSTTGSSMSIRQERRTLAVGERAGGSGVVVMVKFW